MQDFHRNFRGDPKVKIPWVRKDLSGGRILTMEWIDGLRCTDPDGIRASGLDVEEFIRCGVVSGLRQLLEVGPSPEAACSPGLGQACVSTAEGAAGQGRHAGAVLLQPAERTVGAEAV